MNKLSRCLIIVDGILKSDTLLSLIFEFKFNLLLKFKGKNTDNSVCSDQYEVFIT